jgi:hypothetical protein
MLNTKIGENYNANTVVNSNDLRRRIINVDSRFRQEGSESTTNFVFRPEHPYKNIIRMRVASVEIPNMYYTFSKAKHNTTFIVKAFDIFGIVRQSIITLPDGNYTSQDIIEELQRLLDEAFRFPYGIFMTIKLNVYNAKITFVNNGVADPTLVVTTDPTTLPSESAKPFVVDFISANPQRRERPEDFGLGYNLGFRKKSYKASIVEVDSDTGLNTYTLTSEGCLDVVGFQYLLLGMNDLHTVEQKTSTNYIQCLAKIIVREEKQAVIYDDGATLLSNEIIFPSPVDLKVLNIKLMDPYGDVIELCGMNFSFSLEITEVLNTQLYDFYRNYIWMGTIPSVNYKTVQGSPQPLLKGVGPPF